MLFFLLINVKMPKAVGILTIMSRKISCSAELSLETSGPGLNRYNLLRSICTIYIDNIIFFINFSILDVFESHVLSNPKVKSRPERTGRRHTGI